MSKFTLMQIDTENYGWIVSHHKTLEGAVAALAKKGRQYGPEVLVHLMFRICAGTAGKMGDRQRLTESADVVP